MNTIDLKGYEVAGTLSSKIYLTLILFFLILSRSYSQEWVQSDLSHWSYELVGIPVGEDSLALEFYLGDSAENPEGVVGYTIELEFREALRGGASLERDLQGSWVGGASEGHLAYALDADSTVLSLTYTRSDSVPRSGYGFVFGVVLAGSGSSGQSLAPAARGGIIMVDNMDLKRPASGPGPEGSESGLLAWPNPAGEVLYLRNGSGEAGMIRLIDLRGRVCAQQRVAAYAGWELRGLAPGLYIAELESGSALDRLKVWVK